MEIAVLLKHVVDSTEVRFDDKTGELRLRGLPEKISDYDKHAIEAAVKIKSELSAKVTAYSFGLKSATKSLKEAVAMGADEGILITDSNADKIFDPIFTADVLVRAIEEKGGADIILSGAMTEDLTNLITSPSVAYKLEYPHISNVTELTSIQEKKVSGVFEMDGMNHEFQAQLPLVMSVTRKLNEPRLATKIQILKIPMKKVSTMTLGDLGIESEGADSPLAHFDSYTPITKERKKVIISGEVDTMVDELIKKIKEESVL